MLKNEELNPSPILFEVSSEVIIPGGEFIDPAYKHLGHEGYPVLFSAERRRILEKCGLTLEKLESDFKIRAFVSKLNVNYLNPVREGDEVTLISSATQPKPFELVFHHAMKTGNIVDAISDCSYIVLNLQNKPMSVPPNLLERLSHIKNSQAEREKLLKELGLTFPHIEKPSSWGRDPNRNSI